MFLDNKYTRCYYRIIDKSNNRLPDKIYEKHHIFPECLGGKTKNNYSYLTPREHYICHLLLCKMFPKESFECGKMYLAIKMMRTRFDGTIIKSSRLFEIFRNKAREYLRKINTGRKLSTETKAKMSKIKKGIIRSQSSIDKSAAFHRGRKRKESTGKKISAALKKRYKTFPHPWSGKHLSDEHKRKLSKIRTGMKFSPSHIENIRKARLGKKLSKQTIERLIASKLKWLYTIQEPDGTIVKINNLSVYGRNKNIKACHLTNPTRGHTKGYKLISREKL